MRTPSWPHFQTWKDEPKATRSFTAWIRLFTIATFSVAQQMNRNPVTQTEEVVEEAVSPRYKQRGKQTANALAMCFEGERSESFWEGKRYGVDLHMPLCFKVLSNPLITTLKSHSYNRVGQENIVFDALNIFTQQFTNQYLRNSQCNCTALQTMHYVCQTIRPMRRNDQHCLNKDKASASPP